MMYKVYGLMVSRFNYSKLMSRVEKKLQGYTHTRKKCLSNYTRNRCSEIVLRFKKKCLKPEKWKIDSLTEIHFPV